MDAAKIIEWAEQEKRDRVKEAELTIARARRELDEIEKNLTAASADEPYFRIGQVEGIDAGRIFLAFAAIENLATTKRMAEKS